MSNNIKSEELSKAILDYLNDYKEDIEEDVQQTTDEVLKEAKKELQETSPRDGIARKTKYYKGWAIKSKTKRNGKYTKVIWNKTNYQLTHLLEFGHATRNGGRTKAIPHIRPVEEKYKVEFVDRLEKKIKEDSKWHYKN